MKPDYGDDDGRLYDAHGQRKYLSAAEARRLMAAAARAKPETDLFCQLLYRSGCRISEALALTPRRIDLDEECVVFRTLKRRKVAYRHVPLPKSLLRKLASRAEGRGADTLLFPWSRQEGWRRIKALMGAANIVGPQATAKGLRHHFGVNAIGSKVSEDAIGRCLGHANPKSTRIYTRVVGPEERALARRMWAGTR